MAKDKLPELLSTRERLARRLEKAGAPVSMIAKAAIGYYDDYESVLPCPSTQLILDCLANGLPDVADEAKSGAFDATREEASAWFEKHGRHLLNEA